MRLRILAVSVAGLSIFLGTPAGSSPEATKASVPQKAQRPDGVLTVSRDAYAKGSVVKFEFTVTNPTSGPVHFDFDTAQQFDVTVVDPHGVEAWRWAQGRMFAQMLTAIDLKPGESKLYTATWNTSTAMVLPTGSYTATATLTPVLRRAVRGSLLINPTVDPNNLGRATRAQDTGVAFEVNATTVVTASTKFTIS